MSLNSVAPLLQDQERFEDASANLMVDLRAGLDKRMEAAEEGSWSPVSENF